jgi:hypothetical protein
VTSDGDSIKSIVDFPVTPPPGYSLDSVRLRDIQGVGGGEQPSPAAAKCKPHRDKNGKEFVRIILVEINFKSNPELRFLLTLTFQPTQDTKDKANEAYQAKWDKYTQASNRAKHEEFVRAVRERIKLAGDVSPRSVDDLRVEERSVIFQMLLRRLVKGGGNEKPHVMIELIRAIFDVDKMLYFVAENWWMPVLRKVPVPKPHDMDTSGEHEQLTPDDSVGWGGYHSVGHHKYYITEDSNPAPLGASLGWLLQLDGDAHRNAFLNSPFVKALVPIRPGKERAAIDWLERGVEGKDGLDAPYRGTETEFHGKTVREVLLVLADHIAKENTDITNVLRTESVYQDGLDPLDGGFNATPSPFTVFDQWIEVLPTEQIVAVEYQPSPQN